MQKSGEDREGEREEYGEYPRYQLNEAHYGCADTKGK
jgi:hypothetical protein